MVPRDLRSTGLYHLLVVAATLVVASVVFSALEGIPLGDGFYFVILLMTLIGANYTPHSAGGLVLASVLALLSVGIILSFMTQVLGPLALETYWVGLRARRVSRMEKHVIVCGYSATAKVLLERLPREGLLFVVKEPEAMEHLAAHGVAAVRGDYASSEVLRRAGVERCSAVIAVSPEDSENAFVCLTAKRLAPHVPVIATVSSQENKEKLEEVGADHIISPALLSAAAIEEALRPRPQAAAMGTPA